MPSLESSEVLAHKYRVNAVAQFLCCFQQRVAERKCLKLGIMGTGLYDIPEIKQQAVKLLADLDRVG